MPREGESDILYFYLDSSNHLEKFRYILKSFFLNSIEI